MLTLKIIIYILLFIIPAIQLIRDWKFDKGNRSFDKLTKTILVVYIVLLLPSVYFLWNDAQEGHKLQGYITGGDSYCYVKILPNKDERTYGMYVLNEGEFPVFDVSLQIIDQEKLKYFGTDSLESIKKAAIYAFYDRVPAKKLFPHSTGTFPNSDKLDLGIMIEAQNGRFSQTLICRRITGSWRCGTKVINVTSKEVLIDESNPTFPLE